MSELSTYTESMDYVRKRFKLPDSVSLYEAVNKVVAELKLIEEIQKSKDSQEEKTWTPPQPKKSKKPQSK